MSAVFPRLALGTAYAILGAAAIEQQVRLDNPLGPLGGVKVECISGCGGGGGGGGDGKILDGTAAGEADVIGSGPVGTEQGLVVRNIPSGTQPVSGSVSVLSLPSITIGAAGNDVDANVTNFPATQAVTQSGAWSVGVNNFPAGFNVNNFPTTASTSSVSVRCVNAAGNAFESCAGSGGTGGGGDVNITGINGSAPSATVPMPSRLTNGTAFIDPRDRNWTITETVPVSGTFWQATQPISGSVSVSNFPGTQPVSGSVSVSNFPATQQVIQGTATRWTCSLDALAATLTQCVAAPGAGLRYYLTGVYVQTSTATSGTFAVRTGTGTNCGTGTLGLFPRVSTSAVFNAPINSQPLADIQFPVPLEAPVNSAICAIGTATNTIRIQLVGYTGA